jgi:CopG family nickel-responsive transcriptional regulator
MQRVTISLDEILAKDFDDLIAAQGYHSRSEAMRDLVRQAVGERRLADGYCVGSLSYVYDHHIRGLGQRLVELQHEHHDVVVSTTHVHLDHDSCLETAVLKGEVATVNAFAERVQSERGVRFAKVNLISVQRGGHVHARGDHAHGDSLHLTPSKG